MNFFDQERRGPDRPTDRASDADDFGFAFVDAETQERAVPARPPWRRRPRPAQQAPRRASQLSRRVAGLGAATLLFIAVVVATVIFVGGSSRTATYGRYLKLLAKPASDSQKIGVSFDQLLATPSSNAKLAAALTQLARRQQLDLSEAIALEPPGGLRPEHKQAVEALELRVSGLQGLAASFGEAKAATPAAATLLAAEANRLIASDVVWSDLVQAPTRALLVRDGLAKLAAPPTRFITDLALVSRGSFASILQAHGVATPASTATSLMRPGDSGAAVTAWQNELRRWLQLTPSQTITVAVTGTFDAATEAATKALQATARITADGIVGPATRRALQQALKQGG